METKQAAAIFEVLSSDVRLGVFKLLVKNAPDGLVAGEIARQLDIPPTNLSFHLKALLHGGLAGVEKEGRFWRYRANIPLMLELVGYLTSECCSDNPDVCDGFREASGVASGVFPRRG